MRNMQKKYAIVPFVLEKHSKGGVECIEIIRRGPYCVSMSLVVNDLKAGYVTARQAGVSEV